MDHLLSSHISSLMSSGLMLLLTEITASLFGHIYVFNIVK